MKIQGLENKIRQTLTGFKQNIKSKEGVIAILENDNQLNLSKLKRLEKEMTYKDDRLLRLDKIIQASALIFQNRLQLITDLKVQLQKEKNKVGASKEYSDHLNGDIDNLEEQKKELTAKIQELEQASQTNSELRDKELKELREEKQRLTEWKEKVSEIIRASLVSVIYPSDASDDDNLLIQAEYTVSQLNEWKNQFPHQTPLQINSRLLNDKEKKALQQICAALAVGNSGNINSTIVLNNAINNFGSIDYFEVTNPDLPKGERGVNVHFGKMTNHLKNLLIEYQKEKYWWDKWADDNPLEVNEYGDFKLAHAVNFRCKLFFVAPSDRAIGIQFIPDVGEGIDYREFKRIIKEIVCEYYKRKFD